MDANTGTTAPHAKPADNPGIQVLARAADVLRALKADNSGLSLGKIATRVGLPRSTVQRIVGALLAEELVAVNAVAGGYQLGPEILALAQAGRQDAVRALRPVLEGLSRETGETVDLALFRNDKMVFIDQVIGTQRLRTVSAIGETFPMTVTANGKAVLALLDAGTVKRIVDAENTELGKSVSLEAMAGTLQDIREAGTALDLDEHTEGISAAGIAISVAGTIYAISIPAPTQRFSAKRASIIEHLTATIPVLRALLPEAIV